MRSPGSARVAPSLQRAGVLPPKLLIHYRRPSGGLLQERIFLIKNLKENIELAHDLNEVVKGLHWVYSNEINQHFFQYERYKDEWDEWGKEYMIGLLI